MAKKKKLLSSLILPCFALAGCSVDLGVLDKSDNLDSYYDAFGPVKGIYDGGNHVYDVEESLFNEKTINEYAWEKPEYAVAEEQYVYVAIRFKEDLKIESLALVVKSDRDIDMSMSAYYFANDEAAPKKIKYLSSPDPEPGHEEDPEFQYDDALIGFSLIDGTKSLGQGVWTNFGLGNFKSTDPAQDDGCLHVKEDGLFYLRFDNNSGWKRDTLKPFAFTFLDLIVRAIE